MPRLSKHSKIRLVERDKDINFFREAKRAAATAYRSGKPIGDFQKYPKFFSYLQNKNNQTNTCTIRIFHDIIYIWRGKTKTLVTAHCIPERYLQEMEEIDNQRSEMNSD